MRRPIVAIDGPAGAGKTTVTRLVAERLGYVLVDTGALYRAVALAAKRAGLSFEDHPAIAALSEELAQRGAIIFDSKVRGKTALLLDGKDISEAIRTAEISQGASKVSAIPRVRQALLDLQRRAGRGGGAVLEGRDIGTVVFPQAEAKFFLTADVETRAKRRHQELLSRGESQALPDVVREVAERDRRDSQRPVAPLRQAPDAELVDSSNLSVEQVVELIVAKVKAIENRLDDT